jgi:hypothetical protein
MAHPPARIGRLHRLVLPEIAAADGRTTDPHEHVDLVDEVGVGHFFNADITRAEHDRRAHALPA